MRALISVSDKTGVVEFSKTLVDLGYEIISTGGTSKALEDAGISVTPIDQVTGFPEMMNGRVKTLHPKIHGGLLSLRDNENHMASCEEHGIGLIDMVVVNLYPFQATISKADVTLSEAIENIDIGGPSMIRSAAKNYRSVAVVVNPDNYTKLSAELRENQGQLSESTKSSLAVEAFQHTGQYDVAIGNYLAKELTDTNAFPDSITTTLTKESHLRYGENPHQEAAFYRLGTSQSGIPNLTQHHGKELSYNNIVDIESAWDIAKEFTEPAAVIIKHTNPCGVAISDTIFSAYRKAHDADPVSAFGSIIGLNMPVDEDTANAISETFVEAVVAPSFTEKALEILMKKPSIRLLSSPSFMENGHETMYKFVQGGVLVQSVDKQLIDSEKASVPTQEKPSSEDEKDLEFAFKVCKHVKSNAIVIAKDGQAVGVGAGQMSRVESVEIALNRAGDKSKGAVAASDAFFPFKDGVEKLAAAGIKAIIQPGGSKRDQESIDVCDENQMSMLYTHMRHFKH